MATAILLSQHSSNPLEVHSSDHRNTIYRSKYTTAIKANAPIGSHASSDDPLNGYNLSGLEDYHHHIATLYPNSKMPALHSKQVPQPHDLVDLDADMSDDDFGAIEVLDDDHELGDDAHADDDDEEEDEDAQGSIDEEMSICLKPREEQEEIAQEIADLERAVPDLKLDYKLIDRLGTGTFSSVYKAIDLHYHTKWDNKPWQGSHPSSSSAYYQSLPRQPDTKVFVAVKRIYVTSGPERIRNEISIMEDCRSCRHVSQLITAFRKLDQVVAIMPYHRNEDFRDFYRVLSLEGVKQYFRCLFRAFRDIHSRGIIHRDVKPANFLFDPRTGIGTLCDFGLACRMERGQSLGVCLHTAPSRQHPHGRLRPPQEYDLNHIRKMQKEGRMKSGMPSDKVGYPEKDTRPHSKANRAGTRGFRAPEVLLKCGEQTGAIDMWSAGMILLFFLTGKFPLFQSTDDIEALMEIATIIGRRRMEKTATLHSRIFSTNIPSITHEGTPWRDFVTRQNPTVHVPRKPDERYYPYSCPTRPRTHPPPPSSSSSPQSRSRYSSTPELHPQPPSEESYAADIDLAIDLLEQLMQPESIRRITPRNALYHPFLRDPDEPDDDEFFPHPFGEGLCAEDHFYDEVTEEPCVKVRTREGNVVVRRLATGEGIAIGRRPCEFHEGEFEDDDYS